MPDLNSMEWIALVVSVIAVVAGLICLLHPIYRESDYEQIVDDFWTDPITGENHTADPNIGWPGRPDGEIVPLKGNQYLFLAEPGQHGTREMTLPEPQCGKPGCMGRWGVGDHDSCTRAVPSVQTTLAQPEQPALAGVCYCGEEMDHEIHDFTEFGWAHENGHVYIDVEAVEHAASIDYNEAAISDE